MESLDQRVSRLELLVMSLETKATTTTMRITNEQEHVNRDLHEMNRTIMGLIRWMTIVEEITVN